MPEVVAASASKGPGATRRQRPTWEFRFTLEQVFAVVSPFGLLVIWQILSNLHVLDPRIFSSPTRATSSGLAAQRSSRNSSSDSQRS